MNYEQKYKDALERARNLHKDAIDKGESLRAKQWEIIFPELAESEDERIRNEIIRFLLLPHPEFVGKINHDEWIVWLEKQKTSEEALQYLKENHSPSEVSDFQSAMNIAVAKAYDKGIKDGLEKQGKTNVEQTVSHDYVEIGGVKWATKNVGANAITDYGLHFQWGDTQGYTTAQVPSVKAFRWGDYKWTEDRGDTFIKYNNTDGKTIIYSKDDAVTAAWGDKWRMPTHEEYQALYEATTSEWTTMNGVNGMLFTSKEDSSKTLFFPAAGFCGDGSVWYVGRCGYYWSLSLNTVVVSSSWGMSFGYGSMYPDLSNFRYYGYSVRGVMNC